MEQDAEEITIPTETQGFTTLRRLGLMVFLGVSIILSGITVVTLVLR